MNDHCTGELTTLTWDAMWCNERESRVEVPNINSSFHTHEIEEKQMSDKPPFNKPVPPRKESDFSTPSLEEVQEKLKQAGEKANEKLNQAPPELKQAVETSKSFIERNQKEITIGLIALVGLRIYKRKVAKATSKQVLKALEKVGKNTNNSELPNLHDILAELRATPGMAYIPHGGGMVHLLKGRDAIITVFGDFEKMSNAEIWNHVANILNLNVRV